MVDGDTTTTSPSASNLFATEWVQPELDDNFQYEKGNDTTFILQTKSPFELNSNVKFETNSLLVYAETIHLDPPGNGLLKFPGKNIGLFCHTLSISSKAPRAIISVSGGNGVNVVSNTSPLTDVNHGKDGGSITLYVEKLDLALIPTKVDSPDGRGLFLRANGGVGGAGASFHEFGGPASSPDGGNGGDGGRPGK